MVRRGLRSFAKRHWIARAEQLGGEPALPAPPADEELFAEPPNPDAVARRAAVLGAVVTRGLVECDSTGEDPAATLAADLAFYDEHDLARDAEPGEDALIRAPHGTLPAQDAVDATWRAEGLAVLGWALGRLDALPPIDQTVDLAGLGEALELPWAPGDVAVLRSPHLRPAADLERLDTLLLTAHWRVRHVLHVDPAAMDYVAWVPGVEWAPLSLEGLEVVDRDLAVGGVPIAAAGRDLVQTAESILTERRLAVSWLNGYDELYSEGDTNT